MKIKERQEQIVRIKATSFQAGLEEALEKQLKQEVMATVQATLEASLNEEVNEDRAQMGEAAPRRSGYYQRRLDTQYGRIADLSVPKLRAQNEERRWRILQRYQRSLNGLLDYAGYLYVLGLSLRDLQEALYFLLGSVLSTTAINRVTLRVEERMKHFRQARLSQTPPILIVDGVWVEILYTLDALKTDKAGHQRQVRQGQARVILAVMAVWSDGTTQLLHYLVAEQEERATWVKLFDELIARGLDPQAIQLVVSDGTKGLLDAMTQRLPNAQQQRCITHKVRGIEPLLTYQQLPTHDDQAQPLAENQAKAQRSFAITQDAYAIYEAPTFDQAQQRLADFTKKWTPLEPKSVHSFLWGVKRTFVFYAFSPPLWTTIRSTNRLERFFREFRNKADEIGAFPNENSCLTLFFLVLQREHAKHSRPLLANNS